MSALLKDPASPAHAWLHAMQETSALIGGVLRVIHPAVYQSGLDSMRNKQTVEGVLEVLQHWHAPFNALSFMANRESSRHRDCKSHPRWYDLMMSIGHDQDTVLRVDGLGLRLAYPSGTFTAFSGKTMMHEVDEGEAERVCLAYYMQTAVHDKQNVGNIG